MSVFTGEHSCKLDAKGRFLLPSDLKKQVSPKAQEKFMINRGFEKHLTLYPMNEWEIITKKMSKLNLFVKKHRDFVRKFNNGATELTLDASGRLLIPKRLLEYAGIEGEIVVTGFMNKMEVWASAEYEKAIQEDIEDFADLAE
jgi:MraZ protein